MTLVSKKKLKNHDNNGYVEKQKLVLYALTSSNIKLERQPLILIITNRIQLLRLYQEWSWYSFLHISIALQCFLIHGYGTLLLLLATLVPIIKDKLESISISKNYRSISMSSLVLKLLDLVILLLFGKSLGVDQLQFAYQAKALTTMSTWTAVETISYFLINGSEVFTFVGHDQGLWLGQA